MSCPICGNDASARYRPFCSRRCADIDLGKWLTGGYAIPGDEQVQTELPEPPVENKVEKPH